MRFKYVEHTADVEFIAYGRDYEECFKNAMLAIFDTISYTRKIVKSRSKIVKFNVRDRAKTLEDLLWYVLQDTVSIMDSKGLFGYDVAGIKLKETKGKFTINAAIKARKREEETSKLDIKGVSKYNLKIKKTQKGIEASVVLDV